MFAGGNISWDDESAEEWSAGEVVDNVQRSPVSTTQLWRSNEWKLSNIDDTAVRAWDDLDQGANGLGLRCARYSPQYKSHSH